MAKRPYEYITPQGWMTTNSIACSQISWKASRSSPLTCKTNMAICHKVYMNFCHPLYVCFSEFYQMCLFIHRILVHCRRWYACRRWVWTDAKMISKEHMLQKLQSHRGTDVFKWISLILLKILACIRLSYKHSVPKQLPYKLLYRGQITMDKVKVWVCSCC